MVNLYCSFDKHKQFHPTNTLSANLIKDLQNSATAPSFIQRVLQIHRFILRVQKRHRNKSNNLRWNFFFNGFLRDTTSKFVVCMNIRANTENMRNEIHIWISKWNTLSILNEFRVWIREPDGFFWLKKQKVKNHARVPLSLGRGWAYGAKGALYVLSCKQISWHTATAWRRQLLAR